MKATKSQRRKARQATAAEIRRYLGHGEGSRRVRVSRDGKVTYSGCRDPFNRGHDWPHEGGRVTDYRVDGNGTVHQ